MPSPRPLVAVLIVPVLLLLAAAAPVSAAIHDEFEQSVVTKINDLRAEQDLAPLRESKKLARAASRHSRDQLLHDRLSHTSGNGVSFQARAARMARKAIVGETIGWLPDGISNRADRLIGMWMESPGHRAQLMDGRFRKIGVGRWYGAMGRDPGLAVTANFASR